MALLQQDFDTIEEPATGFWKVEEYASARIGFQEGTFEVGYDLPDGSSSWWGSFGTSRHYSLVDRSIEVEVARGFVEDVYPGYHEGYATLEILSADNARRLGVELSVLGGSLGFGELSVRYTRKKVGSSTSSTETFCEQPYVPSQHRWLRFVVRADGDNTVVESLSSADGENWDSFCVLPTAAFFPMNLVQARVAAGGGSGARRVFYRFDNLRGALLFPGAEAEAYCSAAGLADDFSGATFSEEWQPTERTSGVVKQESGRLMLSVPKENSEAMLESRRFLDMSREGTTVTVQLVQPCSGPSCRAGLDLFRDGSRAIRLIAEDETLTFSVQKLEFDANGKSKSVSEQAAVQSFDAAQPVWLRLKNEGDNTIAAFISTDGSVFDRLGVAELPPFASAVRLRLWAQNDDASEPSGNTGLSSTAVFDDLNL